MPITKKVIDLIMKEFNLPWGKKTVPSTNAASPRAHAPNNPPHKRCVMRDCQNFAIPGDDVCKDHADMR